jgi:predicted esterase
MSYLLKHLYQYGIFIVCLGFLNFGVFANSAEISRISRTLAKLKNRQITRPADYKSAHDWDLFQLKLKKVRYLLRYYKASQAMLDAADGELQQAEKLLELLEKKRETTPKVGIAEEAYLDDTDGSVQPFIRYLPAVFGGRAGGEGGAETPEEERRGCPVLTPSPQIPTPKNVKLPLIVYLHGYSPYLNIVNWGRIPDGLVKLASQVNACIAMPFARSNTDFQGIGEQDVLNVIQHMKKRYNIDEDRIILAGMSMGGMGVWTIGAHYPHLFAGLLVISGRGDYYFWHKIKRDSLPGYQQWLIDKEFGASHLQNLSNLPIRSFHGTNDTLIPIAEARRMRDLLGRKNSLFKYEEIIGGNHWIDDKVYENKKLKAWIKNIRRKNPERFEYISFHPAYSQAYWLHLGEFSKKAKTGKITVNIKGDKVFIRATGIKNIILDRNKMPERIRKFAVVKENDFILREIPDYKHNCINNRSIKSENYTQNAQRDIPNKNALVHKTGRKVFHWGPVKDAFLEPFMFVDTGAKDEKGTLIIRERASEWYKFAKSLPRVKAEKNITDDDKKTFNLFLFGEPETSPMIREVLRQTPVKITKDEFIIAGKKYPRAGNGLFVKYRSPWNSAKSVVVQCGIPWGKSCSDNHRYDFLPGYIVYTEKTDPKDPFGGNKALTAGFFDADGK